MGLLDEIEKAEIKNLLGKGWLTHDGMWFYHTSQEFGIDKANELNKAAIKTMAPIEVGRMMRLLGMTQKKIENFTDLIQFMMSALELILPDSISKKLHFSTHTENLICWEWETDQCFAYKGMKQIGLIDRYNCGVMYRIECWLEVMGIKYSMRPAINGCLMHDKGECRGEIQTFF